MRQITVALIGAGERGMYSYGSYVLNHPNEIQFVAVAEPDPERRNKFKSLHGLNNDVCFSDWKELLDKPRLADAVLICTQDRMHFEPAVKALEKGYHVMLEKPMSPDPRECIIMGEYARKYDRIFSICHVLRYTPFFRKLKMLLDQGRIGRLISIQHNENVGYYHYAHSYVRGNWRNSNESSPMILAKCCHDMDIMLWLAEADCTRISSFGSLSHFQKENAPHGAPERCTNGCPAENECPYYAPGLYLTDTARDFAKVLSIDTSTEGLMEALKKGPYGRCVYHCDNNVVDHQVVSIEFANEVTASFTMCGFTKEISRTMKLMGTKGEIRGAMEKNEIVIHDFKTGSEETIRLKESQYGHNGGDFGIMYDFVRLVQNDGLNKSHTSVDKSVQSHIMALAAEKSRLEKRVVNLREFEEQLLHTK